MKKRYNWTIYAIFMLISFTLTIISPNSTLEEEGGKSVYIFSIIIIILLSLFLLYRFKLWYKK